MRSQQITGINTLTGWTLLLTCATLVGGALGQSQHDPSAGNQRAAGQQIASTKETPETSTVIQQAIAPHLTNPVWATADNLRDPAVLPTKDGYLIFYSRFSNNDWSKPQNWAIGCVFTRDFATFTDDHDVSPKGYASPGDPILWHGRYILPFQSYPANPVRLAYITSPDAKNWSPPSVFLEEAAQLPWNELHRVIDPTFVVEGDTLHCYFVGSKPLTKGHANLLGHAITRDPELKEWTILTRDAPLIATSPDAPGGVENIMVFKTGRLWTMIYSEDLDAQHLAYAQAPDLIHWERKGRIDLPHQAWMSKKFGAPFVWKVQKHGKEEKEGNGWEMILMGTADNNRTTFGLLSSPDGIHWTPLPEKK